MTAESAVSRIRYCNSSTLTVWTKIFDKRHWDNIDANGLVFVHFLERIGRLSLIKRNNAVKTTSVKITDGKMSFTPNFLRILVLVMCAVFVLCAQILGNLNEISKLGNCLDYDLRRSPLMVKEVIQKPNNQSNTVLFENDELRWTVRYPAV